MRRTGARFVFPDALGDDASSSDCPARGTLVFDRHGSSWIVTEVLQSGQRTYTVFAGAMTEYRESLGEKTAGSIWPPSSSTWHGSP